MTQSGYFRIGNTVSLGVGVTYANILFYHDIKRKIGIRKSPWYMTITGRCLSDSTILSRVFLVSCI